ncbi:hypothetical protein DT075_23070 [Bacillus licheniformis]|nr:hypothetical protein DT075_23070 [Bacillus licheniformis]
MAIIAEELGIFGVLFVVLLLSFIVLKGFYIARKCIILCSGFSGKTLLKLVLLAGIVLVLVSPLIYFNWDSILTEGRMKRFESYQNPFKDAGDSGFQVVNYGIQPGEFVKLTVILYLSSVYAKKQSYIDNLGAGIAPPAIITLFICALVAAQPDVGTAFIIALIALYFFDRQLMFLALGTVIFLCAALFPYKAFANQKFQKFLLLISVVALFGLFVVGHVAGNAQSWFRVSKVVK